MSPGAIHARLPPMIAAAKTMHRHLATVQTYFTHPISNTVAAGLNSAIQTIEQMACGFRNREHFRTAIVFRCGGRQLCPATP